MPSSSREKSPRVSKVFSKISSDSKNPKNHHHHEEHKDDSKESVGAMDSPDGKDPKSTKPKKSKRGILPYFRGHKSGKKSEKEKEKIKKENGDDKGGGGSGDVSPLPPTNKETEAQLPQVVETEEVEAPELVTKDADVLSSKELSEGDCVTNSVVPEVVTDMDCMSDDSNDFCDKSGESVKCDTESEDLITLKTYSASHSSRMAKYESPLKKMQTYQKSFLHNRFGSNSSVETLPGHLDRVPSSSSSISSISSFSTFAALRSRTLEPTSRQTQEPSGQPLTQVKCRTLDTVRARFHNHVNNLTYEGMNFTSGDQSPSSSSTWSLSSRGFTSPFSKFSLHSSENSKGVTKEKDKKSKNATESKFAAKSGVKKILLSNRMKEDTSSEASPERKSVLSGSSETKMKMEPVSRNLDSITIISNKNVKAKLNITVVKTPEMSRKSHLGSFRFARTGIRSSVRASQKKRKITRSPPSSSPPPSLTGASSLSASSKTLLKTIDGKIIPEYAKVNKRKNSKPDIVEEGNAENVLSLLSHNHESPVEKAPVVKKKEAAAHKARKDCDPSLKVNPVKRVESFKTASRVCRRSSLTYTSRAKMFKEGVDSESFVKTQAVKLRRKDSKNGRLDMKNARRAEYRLSVTIKPSTVATLTNKFNTIISQNQAGNPVGKAELPVGHVSLHETRITRSPKPNIRFKNRTKMGRNYSGSKEKFKEGACLMDEKSIKEEKNREEKRGDLTVPSTRKTNGRTSRSPSPKKTAVKGGKSLLEKLGDNKTDEEKVCEKIKTALSSAKFKGETDDSEDDVVDQETTYEAKYKVCVPSTPTDPDNSVESGGETAQFNTGVPAISITDVSSSLSRFPASDSAIPKILKSSEKHSANNLRDILAKISERNVNHYTEIDEVYPLPERHAKSDSMDSGISTEGDHLSGAGSISIGNTTLIISSVPSFPSCTQEDSSLETVISTETVQSEDSAIALQSVRRKEKGIILEDQESNFDSKDEVCPLSSKERGIIEILETEEKGAIDVLESEEKDVVDVSDVSQSEEKDIAAILETASACTSYRLEAVHTAIIEEELEEEKLVEPDSRSVTSSCMDDTHSEVSSVCSEAKAKKSSKGHESRIYTAVKTAVKNTVKKTKEKDAERKEEKEKERRNRSPSADREKWYKRGRSKERRRDKKRDEKDQEAAEEEDKTDDIGNKDDHSESPKKDGREREGRTYERFTFKKLREKSQERRKNKEKSKEEEEKKKEEDKKSSEESKKDVKNKKKEDKAKEDNAHGMFTIRSRSRSRDCKKNKEKHLEQLALEEADSKDSQEVSPSPKTTDSLKQQESPAAASLKDKDITTNTLPFINRNKTENLVFTFDTESIYDKPLTPKMNVHNMKSKTLPPPPKTPIPSPPSSATPLPPPPNTPIPDPPIESEKDSDSKDSSHMSNDSADHCNGDSDSSNETENIYENLYAPNLEKLHRNREKLEGRGIKPNSSFLWSDGVPTPSVTDSPKGEAITEESENERSPFTRLIGVKTYGKTSRYGKISPSNKSKDSGAEGHNYAELHPSSEDTQTIAYDDIGAVSAVSYDDISAPSSCGYDDIGTSSSTGYDTIKPPSEGYDPVNPPRSDSSQYDDCDGGIVTAQLAVVREDQLDSISYMYDEISMYNASQNSHSYEPVYPPGVSPQGRPGVSSIEEVPETDNSTPTTTPVVNSFNTKEIHDDRRDDSSDGSQDGSEDGIHEVFSYKLTRIGGVLEATPPGYIPTTPTTPSTPGSAIHTRIYGAAVPPPLSLCGGGCEGSFVGGEPAPSPSLSPTEGKSETSDEWMDVSDTETDTSTGPPISITTQIPLVRMRQRSKRWRPRNWRRSWSQGVRDVAAHTHAHTHCHTHSITHHHAHSSSSTTRGDETEYSWREGGDSDDEDNATGHYEAIYEVISPAEDEHHQCEEQDYDDSFDSDDSDEAYSRLRPHFPDDGSQTSRDHPESLSSEVSASEKSQLQSPLQLQQQQQQQQQQQHGITKIAEAANLGMRRLRRNWSLTKNEVRTGLSRIKKKSTFSASDIKSTENLATCDMSPTSADNKRKWSFKSHFRRKSSAGSVTTVVSRAGGPPSNKKESATFYLTLTIETERQDAGEMSDASQQTIRSDSESVLSTTSTQEYRKSNTPSIASMTTVGSSSEATVPLRPRPISISQNRRSFASCSYAPVRPRTAPPAPPPKEKNIESNAGDSDNDEHSKSSVATRTAPPAPPPKEKNIESNAGDSDNDEHSKSSVATRLNQLLSAGPTAPPGRRVLRTCEDSSSDTSPVPVLLHPDDGGYTTLRINSVKYATINMNNSSSIAEDSSWDEKALSPEVTNSVLLNIPQARTSVVSASSHGSSEGYIRPGDIASAPPPLPARRTPVTNQPRFKPPPPSRSSQPMLVHMPSSPVDVDNNSYLDFSCDALNQDEPLYVSSHFADEPLYQFYTAKVLERAAQNQGDCSSEDDYEVINDGQHPPGGKIQTRPTAMELVTPADGRRTLWCELPEVIESGLLSQINSQEKKTQEAMFEMITSEASYLKSLNVLVTHFVQCPEFTVDEGEDAVLSRRERHILFSDILPVKRCSELFLADLEKRWQESVRISTIADIILKHANNHFQVYVKYCSNQIYQDRILKELKENNPRFLEVLTHLESSPVCQSLAMHSFLMLPMQRITRLPLLVDAIFHRLKHDTPEWEECKLALATLTKIVAECNEGARKMERMEEMLILSRQLDFREVKAIPLISASRWLVKKGELTRLTWKDNDKLTFGRRISKHTLFFFLFTDLLVVTKKKNEDQFMVLDYCIRNMVQVLELDAADKFPGRILDGHKNLLIMTMLQNHENKTVEMVVSCPMESDRTRWVEAVTPRTSENPDERIYEEWDCPQVHAIHPYVAKESDELSLEVSDVVNVLKKMADGWYQGERIRDQERGWFPGSFTEEISSTHVRARNLRQRYRLLAISSSLLDELKREKERYEKEEKKKDRRRTLTMKEVISSQAQALN